MVTDATDSPHKVVGQLRCDSYFACAEIDKWAPRDIVGRLEAAVDGLWRMTQQGIAEAHARRIACPRRDRMPEKHEGAPGAQ